jgi:hypothetical protein
MNTACPNCRTSIPAGQIRAATDVALCRACDEVFSLSDLIDGGFGDVDFDVRRCPTGMWYEETATGWRLGASTRSYAALFFMPFTCFWLGMSLLLLVVMSMEVGFWAALIASPFLLIGLFLLVPTLMAICGKVVVSVDRGEGRIFTGVGKHGTTKRFAWDAVVSIEEKLGEGKRRNVPVGIELVGDTRVGFGGWLSPAHFQHMLQGLRKLLVVRNR